MTIIRWAVWNRPRLSNPILRMAIAITVRETIMMNPVVLADPFRTIEAGKWLSRLLQILDYRLILSGHSCTMRVVTSIASWRERTITMPA